MVTLRVSFLLEGATKSFLAFHLDSSASRHQLIVPRHRRTIFRRRAFTVAGPTAWNSLPDYLHDPSLSEDTFRQLLKTYLFALYQCTKRIRGVCVMHTINFLRTYLLTYLQNHSHGQKQNLSLLSRLHRRHLTATVRLSSSLSYAANTARPGATCSAVRLLNRDVEDDSVSSTISVTLSPVSPTTPAIVCDATTFKQLGMLNSFSAETEFRLAKFESDLQQQYPIIYQNEKQGTYNAQHLWHWVRLKIKIHEIHLICEIHIPKYRNPLHLLPKSLNQRNPLPNWQC